MRGGGGGGINHHAHASFAGQRSPCIATVGVPTGDKCNAMRVAAAGRLGSGSGGRRWCVWEGGGCAHRHRLVVAAARGGGDCMCTTPAGDWGSTAGSRILAPPVRIQVLAAAGSECQVALSWACSLSRSCAHPAASANAAVAAPARQGISTCAAACVPTSHVSWHALSSGGAEVSSCTATAVDGGCCHVLQLYIPDMALPGSWAGGVMAMHGCMRITAAALCGAP